MTLAQEGSVLMKSAADTKLESSTSSTQESWDWMGEKNGELWRWMEEGWNSMGWEREQRSEDKQ